VGGQTELERLEKLAWIEFFKFCERRLLLDTENGVHVI
jgi:hypothetical protein